MVRDGQMDGRTDGKSDICRWVPHLKKYILLKIVVVKGKIIFNGKYFLKKWILFQVRAEQQLRGMKLQGKQREKDKNC